MSAMTIKVLPGGTNANADMLARGLARFLLVASLLVVLFAGTFPFDFTVPRGDVSAQIHRALDTRWVQHDPNFVDHGQNLLFLMPFGFAVAAVIHTRRSRAIKRILVGTVASAALSTTVEVLQTLVSFRDPSLVDIWCNTLGGAIGAGICALVGDQLLSSLARVLLKLKPLARPGVLATMLVLFSSLHLSAPYMMRNPGDLSVWDHGMPLVVGNELSGDRGWDGGVWDIALADRAATADEVMLLCRGAEPRDVFDQHLLARYRLQGPAPYKDEAGNSPELIWTGEPAPMFTDQSAMVTPSQWLKSAGPMSVPNHRVASASRFTLATTAASFITDPRSPQRPPNPGPWRIVGISLNPSRQNVMIAQDESDLAVRVRTAIRATPTLYLPYVFTDTDAHHLAVVQDRNVTIVFIDGIERGRCEITPEAKMIWRLYPRTDLKLRLERYGFRSYAAIYRALVFIPFAALLGAALVTSRLTRPAKRAIAVGVILVFALLLETILGAESASGFQVRNLIISLVIGFGTIAMLAFWRRGASRQR